jgi:hypothetical protein
MAQSGCAAHPSLPRAHVTGALSFKLEGGLMHPTGTAQRGYFPGKHGGAFARVTDTPTRTACMS